MAYRKRLSAEEKKEYAAQQEQALKNLQDKVNDLGHNFELNPETLTDYYAFAGKFHQYSARNNELIYSQNPNATFCGSFKFYKDRGYTVTSGKNSSLKIFVPVKVTLFQTGDNEWKKISEATAEEKAALKRNEYQTRQIQKFKIGSVFDISQTNVPPEEYPKFFSVGYKSEEHAAIYEGVKNYCQNELNCPVNLMHFDSISLSGHYRIPHHDIELNDRLNDSRKLETLLHEMGHAIQHNINALPEGIQQRALPQIEFEADSIGMMFQSRFGFEFSEQQKHHLVRQYRAMEAENEKSAELAEQTETETSEKFNINKILESVSNTYFKHIDKLNDYVNVSLVQSKIANIEMRYRDSEGELTRSVEDITKETFAEANDYYEHGKLYAIEGEISPYMCTRWVENGDNQIRFDAVYPSEGLQHMFGAPENMGQFIPGVASKGLAIARLDTPENKNALETYCEKVTARDDNLMSNEFEK